MSRIKFLDETTLEISELYGCVTEHPECIIPFVRSAADLLMIVGMKDLSWDTGNVTGMAQSILEKSGKQNYKISRFPELGHFPELPYFPISCYDNHVLVPKGVKMYLGGGDRKDLVSKEIVALWKEIVEFFDKSLRK